jgi:hypothetical protein
MSGNFAGMTKWGKVDSTTSDLYKTEIQADITKVKDNNATRVAIAKVNAAPATRAATLVVQPPARTASNQGICRPGFHEVPPPPGHAAWCNPD